MVQIQVYDLVRAAALAQIKATNGNLMNFSWFGRNHKQRGAIAATPCKAA